MKLKYMNQNIIEQFEKLIDQIKSDIDHSATPADKVQNGYRLQQITKALDIIRKYPHKIKSGKELEPIKGIGKGTITRIDEILKTGKLSEVQVSSKYKLSLQAIEELEKVYGIGRTTAHDLVTKDGIKTVKELRDKYNKGEIELPHQVVMGLKYFDVIKERIPRAEIDKINYFLQGITKNMDKALVMTISGSYRRGLSTSGDIDVLLAHPTHNYTVEFVKKLKDVGFIVDDLTDKDYNVKYMGFCKYLNNPVRRIDIKFVFMESYYSALMHFTGSDNFNKQIRELAKHMGYLLNEYGLFKLDKNGKKTKVKVNSERDIFDELGLEYIEPSKRE